MKNIVTALLGVLLMMTACEEKSDGYVLDGTILGLPSQELTLEFLTFKDVIAIDTTHTNAEGVYKFEGMLSEPGFCRIVAG